MSTKTYAVIQDSKVVNMILLDDEAEYFVEENQSLMPAVGETTIGWSLVKGSLVPPPPLPEVELPEVVEDPVVTEAKVEALRQLVTLGITEPVARTIVGLPPA